VENTAQMNIGSMNKSKPTHYYITSLSYTPYNSIEPG
jgi:hypothetical protein